jgi:hypothetical protein
MKLEWDENKRRGNLLKHGLDFADAGEVLESRYRMDRAIVRGGEPSFPVVFVRHAAPCCVDRSPCRAGRFHSDHQLSIRK